MGKKRIYEIARELDISSKELIAKLEEMGMSGMKAANSVDEDEHALIVHLFEEGSASSGSAGDHPAQQPEAVATEERKPEELKSTAKKPPKKKGGVLRPPIVSVLGHIDHGKTTLLDAIRKSHLAAKEAGGITQGVAAYQADLHGQKITFIDTPGHKAFTGMRARGAQATDIAILVVAADDGVMAQTIEAIDHIRVAGIPMIVAINKIDKANADVSKVLNDLAQQGLTPEVWGGDTITVEISALQGQHIDDLLEMILLVAEMEDLRADPNGEIEAVIIESHVSSGRGPVATAVVRDGTLREKDWAVAGPTYGRIKALFDETGKRVSEAPPGKAVTILGFNCVPEVGTRIRVVKNQGVAKQAVAEQEEQCRPDQVRRPMTFDELFEAAEEKETLHLVLKAASTGALEAAKRELESLDIEGIDLQFLHSGVGTISESDVLLAASVEAEAFVVGFGVKADNKANRMADEQGISVLTYDIIYDLVNEIERSLKRRLGPEYVEKKIGEAEVRDLFKVPTGVVAGCYVAEGKVTRRAKVRVIRESQDVFVGDIASLRRFDDDVREVLAGRECGIRVKDFDDVQVGDRLLIFELEEIER